MKGLPVEIFKHKGRSCDGAGNFSSRFNQVMLIPSEDFPNISGMFEPTDRIPAVVLTKTDLYGKTVVRAYPADNRGRVLPGWRMFGGCFIYSNDSRFPVDYPVMLMDRLE